jgi:hypothetical protein
MEFTNDLQAFILGLLITQIAFSKLFELSFLCRPWSAKGIIYAKSCLSKERRVKWTREEPPMTWEQSTSSAMFTAV